MELKVGVDTQEESNHVKELLVAPTAIDCLKAEARSVVFGGLDGVATSLALVWSGFGAGAKVSAHTLFVMGVAGLVSQGFSMGMGNYLGASAENNATSAVKSGIVMFISFFCFGFIPLLSCLPSISLGSEQQHLLLLTTTTFSLFLLGSLRAILTREAPIMSGLLMVLIGFVVATLSYVISAVLNIATI